MQTNTKIDTPRIGEGIYLTIDVAEILKLPYANVRYWMNGFWHAHTFGDKGNKAVNFFAMMEFFTYYQLRCKGFQTLEIKKVHHKIAKDLKTDYPFASVRLSTQIDEKSKKRQIWYEYMGYLMKADGKKQPSFKPFIAKFLDQIEFGEDLIAKRYFPMRDSKLIVVDPKRQLGKPIIAGRSIRTDIIHKLYEGGESIEDISILYDLKEHQVADALRFYKSAA